MKRRQAVSIAQIVATDEMVVFPAPGIAIACLPIRRR